MTYKTHITVGLAATAATITAISFAQEQMLFKLYQIEPTISTLAVLEAYASGMIASVVPDIDSDRSKPRHIVNIIVGLSIALIIVLTFVSYKYQIQFTNKIQLSERVIYAIAFAVLILIGSRQPHRHMTHSLLYAFALSYTVQKVTGHVFVSGAFLIGMLSHDFSDIPNKKKVYLFWPLNYGFCLGLFKADGTVAGIVRTIAVCVFLVSLLLL